MHTMPSLNFNASIGTSRGTNAFDDGLTQQEREEMSQLILNNQISNQNMGISKEQAITLMQHCENQSIELDRRS